jgi:hypothetical protein
MEAKHPDGSREFPAGQSSAMQSTDSKKGDGDLTHYVDDSPYSHGTKVASVAIGQKFGVAKGATFVGVKCSTDITDRLQGLVQVYRQLFGSKSKPGRPERVSKTVILLTFGEPAIADKEIEKEREKVWEAALLPFLKKGVPIVLSAGNYGRTSKEVDRLPMRLSSNTFPLIVVGGTDEKGNRRESSPGGPKILVHAPASDIQVFQNDGQTVTEKGTSFGMAHSTVPHLFCPQSSHLTKCVAAPAVAGLIATYMAYERPPWDARRDAWEDEKNLIERVKAISAYLVSGRSSTVRSKTEKDTRVIWNGAPAPPSGLCGITIWLDKFQSKTEWSGLIEDGKGKRIDGCRQGRIVKENGMNYQHPCPALKDKFMVNFSSKDVVTFLLGTQSWTSDDPDVCNDSGWEEGEYKGESVSTSIQLFR